MYSKNPFSKYKDNAVLTAPKEDLTLMLYDGALKFINQAIVSIENKDNIKANEQIIKVQNIFRELQSTLDHKYEISKQFYSMYDYIITRSIDGNIKKDITILEEVRSLIREFRDTWKEAMKLSKVK